MAIPLITAILGVSAIWNILTDPGWIGNLLGILPKGQVEELQKKTLMIKKLLDSAASIVFAAQKSKRSLSQSETTLLRQNAELAESNLTELQKSYTTKFTIYGKQDVIAALDEQTKILKLEIENFKQISGLIPRGEIKTQEIKTKVTEVFDGDTIKIETGETVRLVGIDAPESTTPTGVASKNYLKKRLEGKNITIKSDPEHLKDIYSRLLGVVWLDNTNINIEMLQKGLAEFYEFEPNALVFKKQWKAATTETKITPVKIFVGRVADGAISAGPAFAPKVSDLIDDQKELNQSAQENLILFLQNLTNQIKYEIKIKSSIKTRDGSSQTGKTQKIITGYGKDGTPKTKIITNKFAVMELFLAKEEYHRIKIATINLGAVNSVNFQPTAGEKIAINIPASTLIKPAKESEIKSVLPTPAPAPPVKTAPAAAAGVQWDYQQYYRVATPSGFDVFRAQDNSKLSYAEMLPKFQSGFNVEFVPTKITGAPQTILPTAAKMVCGASDLTGFYSIQNFEIPTVAQRAPIYEQLGLGPAGIYIGAAEQNTRLLAALKKQAGCG